MQDLVFPTRGIDNTYASCASEKLAYAIMKAAGKLGKDFTHSWRYKKYFEAAGFVDVHEKHFQWLIGPWAKGERLKLMRMLFRQELVQGLDGIAMALLTRGLGIEPAKVKEWVEEARGNLMDPGIHAYMPG
jgi:predicted lipid-binding transport protein (Tim44 family)